MIVHTKSERDVDPSERHMGVMFWQKHDEMSRSIAAGLKYFGYRVSTFLYNEALPADLDIVFVCGPFGSLVPVASQLEAIPPQHRPSFVFFMSEQFVNPALPEWFRYWFGILRSRLERAAFYEDESGAWQVRRGFNWFVEKAMRVRYYGDLYWFRRAGIMTALVISSYWTADFLRARGFEPTVFPAAFTPDKWTNLNLERDVPVLWLGKMGSKRRERIIQRIRADLEKRGVPLMVIDGVENPYVFGEERTMLLSRTKIVLNILREKWDDNSMRYVLAIPRGALVVTEPTLPHTAFVPGKHIVEAPIEEIAETICYYLEHEDERQEIVDSAYEELTSHSRMDAFAGLINDILSERDKRTLVTS